MNRAVFAALKPGGVFGVIDHAAAAGSGTSAVEPLHRIEKGVVINEMRMAGLRACRRGRLLAQRGRPA